MDADGVAMGFFADVGRGLTNSVATRIAQIADSGINLIRFMTAPPRNSSIETRAFLCGWTMSCVAPRSWTRRPYAAGERIGIAYMSRRNEYSLRTLQRNRLLNFCGRNFGTALLTIGTPCERL